MASASAQAVSLHPARSARAAGARYASFLFALFALLFLVLSLPYFVVTSNALYCRHTRMFWDVSDCFKFGLKHQSSDIALTGDSSLVFGIEPNLLKQRLHVSSYNLGLTAGGVIFFPRLLLDHYLKRNDPPRLVVLYVSPWTFVEQQRDMIHLWDDGARVAVRHGNLSEIATVFGRDPRRIIQFSVVVLQQGFGQFSVSQTWWKAASEEMQAHRGWFAMRNPDRPRSIFGPSQQPTLSDDCRLDSKPIGLPDRKLIGRFRKAYERRGIHVVVYVAPIPACDASYPAVVDAYAGISDNRPQTLPSHYFVDDGWRVHLTPVGAARATAQFSEFISSYVAQFNPGPASEEQRVTFNRS